MGKKKLKLGDHAFVTKLAGFEHSKYIQNNATASKNEIPLIQGKNIRNGKVEYKFDWYISKEISDLLPRSVLDKKCIVIPYVGSKLGELAIFENDFRCHLASNVAKVELRDDSIDLKYLYYYLKSPYGQLQLFKDKQGSAQPNITMGAIRDTYVLAFEKNSQQEIASVLSALDNKIEINKHINIELEQMAKTLYDYWFVQFDFPNAQGKPYKTSGGKMVYNKALRREIPNGWEVKSLYQIAEFINGLACQKFRPENEEDDFLPVIKIREMNEGISTNTEKARVDIPDKNKIDDGDVLFSWSATLDVKIWTEGTGALNQHIFKVVSKEFPRSFYYFEILNYLQHFKMMAELRKTTMGHITIDHLKTSFISIPPIDLINKLDKSIDVLISKIISTKKQNQQLSALRDWLLPMLMNGQVKVESISISNKKNSSIATKAQNVYKKTYQLIIPASKSGFAKQVLAGKIVSKFIDDPNFTDIKFQKIQFLAEHIIEADLNLNYYCQAAGPYDNKFMHAIYSDFRKQKWFEYKNKKFIALAKQDKIEDYYQEYFSPVQAQLDKLFSLLYDTTEAEAEIIATLYAVWNNRIILNQQVSKESLIEDFYNWSDRKKQYSQEQVLNGLQWPSVNQMEPTGFGKVIKMAKGKL